MRIPPKKKHTFLGTHISVSSRQFWVDEFPWDPRWDMLIPWRVTLTSIKKGTPKVKKSHEKKDWRKFVLKVGESCVLKNHRKRVKTQEFDPEKGLTSIWPGYNYCISRIILVVISPEHPTKNETSRKNFGFSPTLFVFFAPAICGHFSQFFVKWTPPSQRENWTSWRLRWPGWQPISPRKNGHRDVVRTTKWNDRFWINRK